MRLKLLIKNIKHHLLLSIFILFACTIFISSITLSLETNSFLLHVNQYSYSTLNHDYDLVIKSHTGLSLNGTRGENNEFDDAYLRRNSFYNVTILGKSNDLVAPISVFEGSNNDINTAFKQNFNILDNEIVITTALANKLNVSLNGKIDLYIGEEIKTYNIVDIIDGNGMYVGDCAFITGYNISTHYAFKNMYNLIMLEIKDSPLKNQIINHIKTEYKDYTIIDVLDTGHIKSLSTSPIDEILMINSVIFLFILLLLVKMFKYKLKKQRYYFDIIGKNNYYKLFRLLIWLVLIIISFLISIFIVKIVLYFFTDLYGCTIPYKINSSSLLVSLVVIFIVSNLTIIFDNIKIIKKVNNLTLYFLISISLIEIILMIIFRNYLIHSIITIIFILTLTLFLIEACFKLSKYFLPFKSRVVIYDLNHQNYIFKLLQFIYVLIVTVIATAFSTVKVYRNQINELSQMFKIDSVVTTKNIYNDNSEYDQIRINDDVLLNDTNLNIILGLNYDQYLEYLEYPLLNKEDQLKFESDEKYIILSKYFENTYHLNVGDEIELLINEKYESFEILTFVNHFYYKMAIVNHSDYLYYGYVINEEELSINIVNDFNKNKYSIINFDNEILGYISIYQNVLKIVEYALIGVVLIMIFLSIYIIYQELLYQEINLRKLKLLGFNNKEMFKILCIKFIYLLFLIIILGFISAKIILINFDDVAKNFKTIFYIEYDLIIVVLSILVTSCCSLLGQLYAYFKYRKL